MTVTPSSECLGVPGGLGPEASARTGSPSLVTDRSQRQYQCQAAAADVAVVPPVRRLTRILALGPGASASAGGHAVHSAAAGSRRPADSARNPAKASPRRWVTVRLTRIPARGPAQAPPRPRRRSSWQPACRTRARAAAGQAQPGSLRPPRRRATVRVACRTDAVRCVADRSKMSNPIQLRLQPRGPRAAAAAP